MSNCSPCSQRAEDTRGIDQIYTLLSSAHSKDTCSRVILQHVYSMSTQTTPQLTFILYRHIFKPLLDDFYNKPDSKMILWVFFSFWLKHSLYQKSQITDLLIFHCWNTLEYHKKLLASSCKNKIGFHNQNSLWLGCSQSSTFVISQFENLYTTFIIVQATLKVVIVFPLK